MRDCVSLWIGGVLGPVERACFRSVLRHGHPLALYCYSTPEGVPEGVELRDAAEILPQQAVFLHRRNSYAPFSDWFRYELQDRGAGLWLDADVYLLAPIDTDEDYVFGEEVPGTINNAVLKLPAASEAVRRLLAPFRERTKPAWMKRSWRHLISLGLATDPARLPWGMTGPLGLTAVAQELGLASRAHPPEAFYPVQWQEAGWILEPERKLDDMVTGRTVAIHLWNACIARFKNDPAPAGSFLSRLQDEGRE